MSTRCLRERVSIDQEYEWDKLLRASERVKERERRGKRERDKEERETEVKTDEICQKQKNRYLKFWSDIKS